MHPICTRSWNQEDRILYVREMRPIRRKAYMIRCFDPIVSNRNWASLSTKRLVGDEHAWQDVLILLCQIGTRASLSTKRLVGDEHAWQTRWQTRDALLGSTNSQPDRGLPASSRHRLLERPFQRRRIDPTEYWTQGYFRLVQIDHFWLRRLDVIRRVKFSQRAQTCRNGAADVYRWLPV
jgi:hypothetical protein